MGTWNLGGVPTKAPFTKIMSTRKIQRNGQRDDERGTNVGTPDQWQTLKNARSGGTKFMDSQAEGRKQRKHRPLKKGAKKGTIDGADSKHNKNGDKGDHNHRTYPDTWRDIRVGEKRRL